MPMNGFLEDLSTWIELSGEAMSAAKDGLVVLQNSAAVRLLGDHRGESLSALLPGCPEPDEDGSFAAVLTANGTELSVRGMRRNGILLLTAVPEEVSRLSLTPETLNAMRSSLFQLQLASERLMNAMPEKENDLYGASLRHASCSLQRLMEQYGDLDELQRGAMQFPMKPLDLAAVYGALTDTVRCLLDGDAPAITEEYEGSCIVKGDQKRLEQVLMCLLSSSLLRTRAGGRICIRVQRRDERVLLTLEDDGEAIPPERLRGLFSPEEESSPDAQGTGLGLIVAWKLVQLHGGRTVIESREGQGTKICAELPASHALPLRDSGTNAPSMNDVLKEMSAVLTHRAYRKRYTE